MTTQLVTRAEWGARPRVCSAPIPEEDGITVHYGGPSPWTGSTINRSTPERFQATADHRRCASIWRAYQAFHLDNRGWCDIAYTSGVCPHGVRFEGRGPGLRTGAQGTNDGNRRSYATCYIAGEGDPLTAAAKLAFLDEDARLGGALRWGHRDWHSTACPGEPLYRWKLAGFPRPGGAQPPPNHPPPTLPPSSGGYAVPVTIRRNSTGLPVRKAQALLLAHGFNLTVDGIFGSNTDRLVRQFQVRNRLAADGIVGPNTWRALIEH